MEKTKVSSAGLPDQASSEDFLGFTPYVKAIYDFLENVKTKPPFTLSVEGDWGSGKSSFMLQLQKKLKQNGSIVISFNAWRHDKVESMWAAFVLTFIDQLERNRFFILRWILNLVILFRRFDFQSGWFNAVLKLTSFSLYIMLGYAFVNHGGLTHLDKFLFSEDGKIDGIDLNNITTTLGFIGFVIGGLYFTRKIADIFGNPMMIDLKQYIVKPNYEGHTSFIENFHLDFDKVVGTLAVCKKKVYVFVDDLDRAEIPKAVELMQGLNMMISNSPKLIFVIGMDRNKVVAGVAVKYEALIKQLQTTPLEFGNSYLQKFIQLSFKIPSPSENQVRAFINAINAPSKQHTDEENIEPQLHSIMLEDGADADSVRDTVEILASYFDNNPRQIKQFLNAFRLKCHIAFNTGLFLSEDSVPLTIPQIGKFVAMTILWPTLVNDMLLHPKLIEEVLSPDSRPEDSAAKRWKETHKFTSFLKEASGGSDDDDYSMKEVDFRRLLETSPAMLLSKNARLDIGDSDEYTSPAVNPIEKNPTGGTGSFDSSFDSTFS